jgi:thiamine-phosphate pyrophosphorylase
MSFTFDRFYPIVDSAAWVDRLTRLGAKLIQLRIKDRSPDLMRDEIRAAREACARSGTLLVVNDYWRLALDERCSFVHLGQGDLDAADVPHIRARGLGLGISTHDAAELERALALQPDYIALGPIYPTVLKQMPWAPQGLERLAEWKRLVRDTPLVAIGGLTVERLPNVFAAGADIAAVVTDIVRNANADQRTREWLAATRVGASRVDQ